MKKKIVTFGEIMLRLSPQSRDGQICGAREYLVEPGGSESNVAIALSHLGLNSAFVTLLPPDNPLSGRINAYLRFHSVDTSMIREKDGRLGTYWTENGIGLRNSFVVYDREFSAFSKMEFNDFPLSSLKKAASWFHVSGIVPAISKNCAQVLGKLLPRIANIPISIDLNYRSKLWTWANKETITRYTTKLCCYATLIIANETDIFDSFGDKFNNLDVPGQYTKTAKAMFKRFKKLKYLAISLRKCLTASKNDWGGILFVKHKDGIKQYLGSKFSLANIVDRVGAGDAFAAGIIQGLNTQGRNYQNTIDFAVTLSALKHYVRGDCSTISKKDVSHAMETKGSGKIIR